MGALLSTIFDLADRYDPRRVFAVSALCAGIANASLIWAAPGSFAAVAARFVTGSLLAGVYPVGMKIAVGWGQRDRGFLVGALVGALTLGSASPHLIALIGGANWRSTVASASIASAAAGLLCLAVSLGPYDRRALKFDARAMVVAWKNRRVRLAYAGYLGHMWELYAMWAWIAAATAASYGVSLHGAEAERLAKITAFVAIGAGGITCVLAGKAADRIGKANVTIIAMATSGMAALATASTFGGPVWITFVAALLWGMSVIPDSAQFSALVADASPPELAGSLMTLQTALGFALTIAMVQATPILAAKFGWPSVLAGLAIGPAFGILAMIRLKGLEAPIHGRPKA
jgi:MFS family permease